MANSTFNNGFWTWDDEKDCLKFTSHDEARPRGASISTVISVKPIVPTKIKFRDRVDVLQQMKFRRRFQRQCNRDEPVVVTLQDIKDVALFTADAADLSVEFISYFHLPTVDKFLRALIIYFQYYIQVWDDLTKRREERQRKLWQPIVDDFESVVRDDLADLRSMVAREYCSIIGGMNDMKRFHHLNNKNKISLSDRDRKLFETLICLTTRVTWIALQRKNFTLLDIELNRLLRTEDFNLAFHNLGQGYSIMFARKPQEKQILRGSADVREKKLLQHSPAANEQLLVAHDHRMLAIGIVDIEPTDARLQYLEVAYTAPEEILLELGVTVGILGLPRDELDPMLMAKPKSLENIKVEARELPKFQLPPKVHHSYETMPKEFPKKSCKYKETERTRAARERQCKIWKAFVRQKQMGRTIAERAEIQCSETDTRFVSQSPQDSLLLSSL